MNKWDFYDHDKAEEVREQHSQKQMDIYKRYYRAKEKGDNEAMAKAVKALVKHKEKGEKMKEWASKTGFYWY